MGKFLGIKMVSPPGFTYRQTVAEICRITEGHSYCTALARGSKMEKWKSPQQHSHRCSV